MTGNKVLHQPVVGTQQSGLRVIDGTLYFLNTPPVEKLKDPKTVTAKYAALSRALRKRNPQADALHFFNKGQRYSLITNATMTYKQQERNYPGELHDPVISRAVEKVCPQKVLFLEGENDFDYEYIRPKPKSVQAYQLDQAEYVSRWNETLYRECRRLGKAPDLQNIPPVKATHKIVSRLVFIIDEAPFTEPRSPYGGEISQAIYTIRLARAMAQKNPVTEAKNALARNEVYLLGQRWVAVGMSGRFISFGMEEDPSITYEESQALNRACTVRMLEGYDLIRGGQSGSVDLSSRPDTQKVEQHHELTRRLSDTMTHYNRAWNRIMLPACRARLKR
ncbi:MAG: hypothetical protein R3F02_08110 [Thiolinea sp.]